MSVISFNQKGVGWYVDKLKNNDYFSFPGFSDAEWLAMEKCKVGNGQRTGGGQLYTELIGDQLTEALRFSKKNYLKAAPLCMHDLQWVYGGMRMVQFLVDHNIPQKDWEFWERDMVTDDLARAAGINPWIKQLREMDVVFISNKWVRNINYFMPYKHYVEIPKLDVYTEENWIDKYVEKIMEYGKPAVYVFAAGFAAAPLIHHMHGKIPNSWFLDLGSMWDCFVGIGSQRGWRAELYQSPSRWEEWITKVLDGIPFDMEEAKRIRDIGLNRDKLYGHENG